MKNSLLLLFSVFWALLSWAVPERITVERENLPKNPFGEPVRVEGVTDTACLKYEAATKRLELRGQDPIWACVFVLILALFAELSAFGAQIDRSAFCAAISL